jgi:hypothetical protein
MPHENSRSSIEKLWQGQATDSQKIAAQVLRRKMQKFERRIVWRNLREYVAGAIVAIAFAYYTYRFPMLLVRIGCVLVIVGAVYVLYELHRRASAEPAPAEMAMSSCVEFQLRQLERQRDALRAVWSWYLLPFLPGMCVFLLGIFQFAMRTANAAGQPFSTTVAVSFFCLVSAGVAVVFFAVWKLNQWAAKKLQMQIDELNTLMRDQV